MSTEKKPAIARYGLEVLTSDKLLIPVGTTGERDATPKVGYFRYNSDSKRIEWYSGAWDTAKRDLVFNAVISTASSAIVQRMYPINTTTAGVTLTLPSNPILGDRVGLMDSHAKWDTNAVTVNGNGNFVEGAASTQFNILRDFVVLVWTGVSARGWVRESGAFPSTATIDAAIALKADITYVDAVHERTNVPDQAVAVGAARPIFSVDATKRAVKATVAFLSNAGETQLFDLLIVKDSSNNNLDVTVLGEVRSNSDFITFNVTYASGIVITANTTAAGVFKTRVLASF